VSHIRGVCGHQPEVVVVDDFLPVPDLVRQLALEQTYEKMGSAGKRSVETFRHMVNPAIFEDLLHRKLTKPWDHYLINGRFQFCTAEDPLVYHADEQSHAGIIFLTPEAPVESGISLVRSRVTGARDSCRDTNIGVTYDGNLFDGTKWDVVDKIGNIYNRLILWNGRLNHAPSCYFGTELSNARLFWMFFFDAA
jgi:hypothetical protein